MAGWCDERKELFCMLGPVHSFQNAASWTCQNQFCKSNSVYSFQYISEWQGLKTYIKIALHMELHTLTLLHSRGKYPAPYTSWYYRCLSKRCG